MQILFFLAATLLSLACADSQEKSNVEPLQKKSKELVQFKISSKLNEISGLCLTDDNRLFAHNDEKGAIYQIDYSTGKIIKSFFLGNVLTVNQDFEGLAHAEKTFYLISSDGLLYIFKEGKDRETVAYETIDLKMNSKFDVEGLCYDPETNALLIACKEYAGKNFKGNRTIYSMNVKRNQLDSEPRFVISLNELNKKFGIKDFFPSAIERSVDGNSFFILSSKGEPCLIEISNKGKILNAKKLPKKVHRQPEGLAIFNDDKIIIADEAAGKMPTLTIYHKNPLRKE